MKAARILQFGPPSVITSDDLPQPVPGPRQLIVHVKAAGVGPWDALIREGRSGLAQPLPLILGSELSGIVEAVGPGVSAFKPDDEVYGATNDQFTGAYAEYAMPLARMMALKPKTLSFIEAASVPVVAVTAWQMLFDYAHVTAGQSVLIHGAAGNVGAYAVQLASQAGLHVVATSASADLDYVRRRRRASCELSHREIRGILDWNGLCARHRWRRHAATVAPSPEAGRDSRLGCVTCSRATAKVLRCSSSVLLRGSDNSTAEQNYRIVRQRQIGYGRGHCAPARRSSRCPRDAPRCTP